MILPLFRLPMLAYKLILETMGFIEIFVLTSTSMKTKRIFQNLVTVRNYQLVLFLREGSIVFDFRTQSDPSSNARIFLEPEYKQRGTDFLLKIGSEHVSSRFCTPNGEIRLRMFWDMGIVTGAKLFDALFDVFRIPLGETTMILNVPFETIRSWMLWNDESFSDIPRLNIKGTFKISFVNYVWILKNIRTKHQLYFQVEPTVEYPNNLETIDFQTIGATYISIYHGGWINLRLLNSIKAHNIKIWRTALTDREINNFLSNLIDSEEPSNWKTLEIIFDWEADLENVLEDIDVTDENLIKPADVLNQWVSTWKTERNVR